MTKSSNWGLVMMIIGMVCFNAGLYLISTPLGLCWSGAVLFICGVSLVRIEMNQNQPERSEEK